MFEVEVENDFRKGHYKEDAVAWLLYDEENDLYGFVTMDWNEEKFIFISDFGMCPFDYDEDETIEQSLLNLELNNNFKIIKEFISDDDFTIKIVAK